MHLHVQAAVLPGGILCVRYLFFLLKKKKPTPFVSIALLHSLLSHHVASPLAGTQHTPCVIADIKITCQNPSILAPLRT